MLKGMQSWFFLHIQAALSSLLELYRRPIATLLTVLVVAITMVLPALFWIFSDNVNKVMTGWKRSGHISLYLQTPLPLDTQRDLLAKIRNTPGVEEVLFISPEAGLLEMQSQEGMQDIMHYLPKNPLPPVLEVTPDSSMDTPSKIEALYTQLKSYSAVEQATLDLQWLRRLHAILDFLARLGRGLAIVLALAVVLIIGNTLRLSIHHRYEEIQVLKLVGATDAFIIRPFLYSGLWYGFGGALLAIVFLYLLLFSLTWAVNQLALVYQMHYALVGLSVAQVMILLSATTALGWLGAFLSVKRYLTSIEPTI